LLSVPGGSANRGLPRCPSAAGSMSSGLGRRRFAGEHGRGFFFVFFFFFCFFFFFFCWLRSRRGGGESAPCSHGWPGASAQPSKLSGFVPGPWRSPTSRPLAPVLRHNEHRPRAARAVAHRDGLLGKRNRPRPQLTQGRNRCPPRESSLPTVHTSALRRISRSTAQHGLPRDPGWPDCPGFASTDRAGWATSVGCRLGLKKRPPSWAAVELLGQSP